MTLVARLVGGTIGWTLGQVIMRGPGFLLRWRRELLVALVVWQTTILLLIPVAVVWGWPRIVGDDDEVPRWLRHVDRAVRRVREPFVRASLRRRLRTALVREKLPPLLVRRVERTGAGWTLSVRFPPGCAGWDDRRHSTRLAASMH